jgi:signal transduction histidine kinase
LQNPLGAIKLSAQSLQRVLNRGETPEPARLESSLAAIDAMSMRATFLLDDIVDVVRSRGREGVPFTPQPLDLVELVQSCAVEAGAVAGRPVQVESATGSLLMMGDPRALERVVHNLVNNALKYSPRGGDVTARIDTAGSGPQWVIVTVTDEGLGIPGTDLPHIFEPYRRGRNVGQIRGTGLGLTGVKQVVERHGGTVDIDSAEGHGTRVTVRLPLHPPDAEA